MVWIYWKEQCKFCKNRMSCEYKENMKLLIEKLSEAEKSVKNVYGSLNFYCDYKVIDEEEYYRVNQCECKKEN